MKLKVSRFRVRNGLSRTLPDATPPAEDALPPGAEAFSPGGALFDNFEDGFDGQTFETAKGDPSTRPPRPSAVPPGSVEVDAIKAEGLTARQLRMARRLAQRRGLPATSDFDAVRLLRLAGIDPFQRSNLLELVRPEGQREPLSLEPQTAQAAGLPDGDPAGAVAAAPSARSVPVDGIRLPAALRPAQLPSTEQRAEMAHLSDLVQIQADIARRRRRKTVLLLARLAVFVFLPALIAGYYFYAVATPMFATRSEFQIQQAENVMAGGVGSLLRGTPMASAQDAVAVQGFLQSREAMLRLDQDQGFIQHFSGPQIDELQRLQPGASIEEAFKTYSKYVKISYDPTEGLIKLEVMAADPQTSLRFNEALIRYAEEQIDQLTQRLREDQMQGARESYQDAEAKMMEAQGRLVALQEKLKVISSEAEIQVVTGQISQLETQITTEKLSLEQMLSNPEPNEARMEPIRRRIATLENQIVQLRARLTETTEGNQSLAKVRSELLIAESEVKTRELILMQTIELMETSRVEANRQTRYLTVSVHPIAPDAAAYPRAFENTLVALLIFAGIYLLIAMTAEIVREQVSG